MDSTKTLLAAVFVALLAGLALGVFGAPLIMGEDDPDSDRPRRPVSDADDKPDTRPKRRQDSTPDPFVGDRSPTPSVEKQPDPETPAQPVRPLHTIENSISSIIAAAPMPERPVGDGVIRGKVTIGIDGPPLAGVEVSASLAQKSWNSERAPRSYPADTARLPDDSTLRTRLENIAKSDRESNARKWSIITEADGSYSLTGLPTGQSFSIIASHPRHSLMTPESLANSDGRPMGSSGNAGAPSAGRVSGVYAGSEINFVAVSLSLVSVKVVYEAGTPENWVGASLMPWPKGQESADIDEVFAAQRNTGRGSSHTTIVCAGDHLLLSPGTYILKVNPSPEAGMVKADPVRIDVVASAPEQEVTIRVVAAIGVHGTIVNGAGDFLDLTSVSSSSDYRVSVAPAKEGVTEPRPSDFSGRGSRGVNTPQRAIAANDAKFAFPDLDPGEYFLALLYGERIVQSKRVSIGTTVVEETLTVTPPAREEYCVVWVKSPTDELIRNSSISARLTWPGGSTTGGRVLRRADGSQFVFHPVPSSGNLSNNKDAKYSLRIRHSDYGEGTVEYQLGSAPEVNFKFQETATLVVTVDGLKGHALEQRIRVTMSGAGESSPMGYGYGYEGYYYDEWGGYTRGSGSSIGSGGVYRFGPVQPNEVTVRLALNTSDQEYGNAFQLEEVKHTLRPGENTLFLRLPQLYSITIHAPESPEGAHVSVNLVPPPPPPGQPRIHSSSRYVYGRLNADRRIVFDALPAGEYSVNVSASGGRSANDKIVLPGTTIATVVPPPSR